MAQRRQRGWLKKESRLLGSVPAFRHGRLCFEVNRFGQCNDREPRRVACYDQSIRW